MKKLMKRLNFAIIGLMVSASSASAASAEPYEAVCLLAKKFGGIFEIIQILAFVGAGISIAGWAWGYISGGKAINPTDEVKNKGIPMLIGFILLFGIGTLLRIFIAMTAEGGRFDCVPEFFGN